MQADAIERCADVQQFDPVGRIAVLVREARGVGRHEFVDAHLAEGLRVEGAAQEQAVVGDTPNLAARLQALAEPGGICISGTVHEQVRARWADRCEDMGEQSLKNIPAPVRAFRVKPDAAPSAAGESAEPGAEK